MSICGVTFVVFLVLKLTGLINWSWWWVTAPLWIPAALYISAWAVLVLILLPFILFLGLFL